MKILMLIWVLFFSVNGFCIGGSKSVSEIDNIYQYNETVYDTSFLTFEISEHLLATRNQIIVYYKGKVVGVFQPQAFLNRRYDKSRELISELEGRFISSKYVLIETKEVQGQKHKSIKKFRAFNL